jgi:hypothetical protein
MTGYKLKVILLLVAVFIIGGAAAVVQYAYGSEVVEQNQNMFMVSHTEYRYGEAGQIIVRLVDFQGDAIAVTNCTVSILNPDKSFFIQDALMADTGNITGDHYYDFTTPAGPEGIYEYQATCNYAPNKQKSATNSFHLSSAFNITIAGIEETLADLAAINSTVLAFQAQVQDNFSQVQASIASINVTGAVSDLAYTLGQVNVTVNGISSNLDGFIVNTTAALVQINTTVTDNLALSTVINSTVNMILADLLEFNTTMNVRFDAVDLAISNGFSAMAANFTDLRQYVSDVNTSIIDAINALITGNISVTVDFTPVLDAISNVNSTLYAQINAVNLSVSSSISEFRQEVQANFSQTWDWFNLINITTVNTYDYMTGTLATNINDILSTLGVINATVNRIEANTLEINTTTQQILQNQEDEVYISTYSG